MKIPIMLRTERIINKAFKQASKTTDLKRLRLKNTKFIDRARQLEKLRIETSYNVSKKELENIVLKTPRIDELPDFYREFVESQINIDKFKQALNHCAATEKNMFNLRNRYLKGVKFARNAKECEVKRKRFYGRMASFFNDLKDDVDFLIQCARELSIAPKLNEQLFTIIIVGMPNVGKSTLLKNLTGSTPQIAQYPFTTKKILIGHFSYDYTEFQILDTPGILDRPNKDRNKIELQAVGAIKHLADAIIFVFDATETCGFSRKEQRALFTEIQKSFPIPTLLIFSKTDIIDSKEFKIHAKKFKIPIIKTAETSTPSIENLKKEILLFSETSSKVRLSKKQLKKQSEQ